MSKNTVKNLSHTVLIILAISLLTITLFISCGGGGGGGDSSGGGTQTPDNSIEYVRQMIDLINKLETNQISSTDYLTQLGALFTRIEVTPGALQQFQNYLENIFLGSTPPIQVTQALKNSSDRKENIETTLTNIINSLVYPEINKPLQNQNTDLPEGARGVKSWFNKMVTWIEVEYYCNDKCSGKYCCDDARKLWKQGEYNEAYENAYAGTNRLTLSYLTKPFQPPPMPLNFSLPAITDSILLVAREYCEGQKSTIWLAWTALSGAKSYDIYRNGNLLAGGIVLRNYTDNNLIDGGRYSYYVAVTGGSAKYNSNIESRVAKTCQTPLPPPLPTSSPTSSPTSTTTSVTTSVGPSTSIRPTTSASTTSTSTTTSVAPTPNPFRGSLSGSWSGTCPSFGGARVSGSFTLNIDSNGVATGSYSGSQSGSINGNVSSSGTFFAGAGAGSGGVSWSGNFSLIATMLTGSGGWSDPNCSGGWSGP